MASIRQQSRVGEASSLVPVFMSSCSFVIEVVEGVGARHGLLESNIPKHGCSHLNNDASWERCLLLLDERACVRHAAEARCVVLDRFALGPGAKPKVEYPKEACQGNCMPRKLVTWFVFWFRCKPRLTTCKPWCPTQCWAHASSGPTGACNSPFQYIPTLNLLEVSIALPLGYGLRSMELLRVRSFFRAVSFSDTS